VIIFTPLLSTARPSVAAETADLIIQGGRMVTMDQRAAEVEAIAVRGDRILAVGSKSQIASHAGPETRTIQLQDEQLVIPGFIEGHGHFLSLGESKMALDLTTAKRWQDIVDQVAEAARNTPPGAWIVGRGWHQNKWQQLPPAQVEGCPVHDALSAVSPVHPVLLRHASGHMSMVNAKAMELAGLDADTQAPAGGEILRDASGGPTGVLRENAMGLVSRVYSRSQNQRSAEQKEKDLQTAIRLAGEECLQHGVTSFQDAGTSYAMVDIYKQLAAEGKLPVRLWIMLSEGNEALASRAGQYRTIGYGNNFVTVRAIKRLLDGALGTHGAWLLQPYEDLPGSTGLNTLSLDSLRRTAEVAVTHDLQLCVHAIGDRANREVLNIFEQAFNKAANSHDLRWRVEHAQHLSPDDIPRFAQLGVIAAMQSIHCTSDAPYVIQRLGMRRAKQGAYVWRSLLDSGATIVNGTDVPVEAINPIACYYAAVTRRLNDDVAFFPEQCMSRHEALRTYTRDAAWAAFEEETKGSITPGKLADIVVLSQDILTVPAERIRDTRVLMTFVGGRLLYEAEVID
jgi:predicted amidohydrolase YtcJ